MSTVEKRWLSLLLPGSNAFINQSLCYFWPRRPVYPHHWIILFGNPASRRNPGAPWKPVDNRILESEKYLSVTVTRPYGCALRLP